MTSFLCIFRALQNQKRSHVPQSLSCFPATFVVLTKPLPPIENCLCPFLSFLQCLNIVLVFAVDGKISPSLSGDFKPSQLLESTVQIRSDINPRYGRFLRLYM